MTDVTDACNDSRGGAFVLRGTMTHGGGVLEGGVKIWRKLERAEVVFAGFVFDGGVEVTAVF